MPKPEVQFDALVKYFTDTRAEESNLTAYLTAPECREYVTNEEREARLNARYEMCVFIDEIAHCVCDAARAVARGEGDPLALARMVREFIPLQQEHGEDRVNWEREAAEAK